jgi:hypothetical protein
VQTLRCAYRNLGDGASQPRREERFFLRRFSLILVVLLITSSAAFADWAVGAAAFYQPPGLIGVGSVNLDQLSVGGTIRLKLGWFQTEALLLYSPGNNLDVYLDAGLALDAAVFRLSLGAGQSFRNSLAGLQPRAGLNWKVGAEVLMGRLSAGVSCIMDLGPSPDGSPTAQPGLLGLNLVFWI